VDTLPNKARPALRTLDMTVAFAVPHIPACPPVRHLFWWGIFLVVFQGAQERSRPFGLTFLTTSSWEARFPTGEYGPHGDLRTLVSSFVAPA